MAQGKGRDLHKERHWRRWIEKWQSSGLSARSFCRQHHLSEPNFYSWRWQLRRRDAAAAVFVPVRVVANRLPSSANTLELLLAGGQTVRVPVGFDGDTLRQVLAILEDRPC